MVFGVLKQVLQLKGHYNDAQYYCHLCRAGRSPGLEFTRFAITAAHRATRLSSRRWFLKYSAAGLLMMSPLLLRPGFCIWRCTFDAMHTIDLGVYQVTLPSVFLQLTAKRNAPFRGRTLQARFDQAYRKYKRWTRQNKVKAVVRHKFKVKQWRQAHDRGM